MVDLAAHGPGPSRQIRVYQLRFNGELLRRMDPDRLSQPDDAELERALDFLTAWQEAGDLDGLYVRAEDIGPYMKFDASHLPSMASGQPYRLLLCRLSGADAIGDGHAVSVATAIDQSWILNFVKREVELAVLASTDFGDILLLDEDQGQVVLTQYSGFRP